MSYLPSAAYVAEQLFAVGAETSWDDAPQEEKDANMVLAKTAIATITSWLAQHRGNGLARYCFEQSYHAESDTTVWAIHDRTNGLRSALGVLHDPLLAQQVVDDLNKRDIRNRPLASKAED